MEQFCWISGGIWANSPRVKSAKTSPILPTKGRVLHLTKVGTDTVILSGASNGSTTTTISAGTLQIGAGGSSGALGSGAVTDNGTLAFNRTDSYGGALSTAISGSGALTLSAGTLTLSGTNTYTGTTTIGGDSLFKNEQL